jgi:hypothetical protein
LHDQRPFLRAAREQRPALFANEAELEPGAPGIRGQGND